MDKLIGKTIEEVEIWLFENGFVRKSISPTRIEAGKIFEDCWYEFKFFACENGTCHLINKIKSEIIAATTF